MSTTVTLDKFWSAILCLVPPLALIALTVWISFQTHGRDLDQIRQNQARRAYRSWNDPATARQVQVLLWIEALSIVGFVLMMFRFYQTGQTLWFYAAVGLGVPGVVASTLLYRKVMGGK